MPRKPPAAHKTKLTDLERHKRFVDAARESGADESAEAFERAFKKVVHMKAEKPQGK